MDILTFYSSMLQMWQANSEARGTLATMIILKANDENEAELVPSHWHAVFIIETCVYITYYPTTVQECKNYAAGPFSWKYVPGDYVDIWQHSTNSHALSIELNIFGGLICVIQCQHVAQNIG